nr:zinc finger protein 112-like [Penaeus vannamei]
MDAPSLLQAVAPVVCPVCGKSVSGINGKQKLRYHMLTHTGERLFQCPHCLTVLASSSTSIATFERCTETCRVLRRCSWRTGMQGISRRPIQRLGIIDYLKHKCQFHSRITGTLVVEGFRWCHSLQGGGRSGKLGGGEAEALACSVCGKLITGRNRRQRLQYHLSTHSGERPTTALSAPTVHITSLLWIGMFASP